MTEDDDKRSYRTAEPLDSLLDEAIAALEGDFQSLTTLGRHSASDPEQLLGRLLDRVYESCQSVLPYDRMSLALIGEGGDRVSATWVRTGSDHCALGPGFSARLSQSSLASVLRSGRPRIMPDLRTYSDAHPDSQSARSLVAEGMRSSLTFPLFVPDKPVGFLFFTSRTAGTYEQHHVDSFRHVAERVSYAIEKCRLFSEMLSLDTKMSHHGAEVDRPDGAFHSTQQMTRPTVLCIEEDELIRELCSVLLRDEGYAVTAVDGPEAVGDSFGQAPPDLVLLGLHDGGCAEQCLCTRIRTMAASRDLPILALLPDATHPGMSCGRCRSADGYMLRPIRPAELRLRVAEALQHEGARPGIRAMPVEGELFSGRYRVAEPVGKGANSIVYRAFDTSQPAHLAVALKVQSLPSGQATNEQFMRLFLREAYQHSKLNHPNISRLLDFGHFGGAYFLATEFVEGQTLDEIVRSSGPMAEIQVISTGLQIAEALDYFAGNHIVHRDIKAQNIMLTEGGRIKILDFGLTMDPGEEGALSHRFSGTPMYAAPECIRGGEAPDVRSDVYALGVTLYYMVSGHYPFRGDTPDDVLSKHLNETPEPLSAYRPEVSPHLCELLKHMLAKKPGARPHPSVLLTRLRAFSP